MSIVSQRRQYCIDCSERVVIRTVQPVPPSPPHTRMTLRLSGNVRTVLFVVPTYKLNPHVCQPPIAHQVGGAWRQPAKICTLFLGLGTKK